MEICCFLASEAFNGSYWHEHVYLCVVSSVYQVVIAPGVLQTSLLFNSGPPGHLVACLCVLLSVFTFIQCKNANHPRNETL